MYLAEGNYIFNAEHLNSVCNRVFSRSVCAIKMMNFYGMKKTRSDAEFKIVAKSDEVSNDDAIGNQRDVNNGILRTFYAITLQNQTVNQRKVMECKENNQFLAQHIIHSGYL